MSKLVINQETKYSNFRRLFSLVLFAFMYAVFITGSTYAYLTFSAINSTAMSGSSGCGVINYNGTEVIGDNLSSTDNYINGAHSVISLYKNAGSGYAEAVIYIHNNDGSDIPFSSSNSVSDAFKYIILDGETVISSGVITQSDEDQELGTIVLTTISKNYDVYIWIDSTISNGAYNGVSYSGYLYAVAECTSGLDDDSGNSSIYELMASDAVIDNIRSTYVNSDSGIDFTNISSDTNGKGIYMRAGTENDTYPIYYYRGDVNNNNVIFADMCWKMVITTETGGVKMIYNGVPVDGKCNNTGVDTQIGTKKFNSNSSSPADVGYMYGTRYAYSRGFMDWYALAGKSTTQKNVLTKQSSMSNKVYYYGDQAVWNGTAYELQDTEGNVVTSTTTWNSTNYQSLIGKYTCNSATKTTCATVRYIGGGTTSAYYYVPLTNNTSIDNYRIVSNTISYTEGVGYTLTNPVNVAKIVDSKNWYTNYKDYKGYYFCGGTNELNATTCGTVYYINLASLSRATVVSMSNGETYDSLTNQELLFGNSVDSSGVLQDTISIKIKDWSSTGYKALNSNHYTCFSTSSTCSTIYYVYYTSSSNAYYITLPLGKTISDALSEMLDYNTTSSTIKGSSANTGTIDYWYYNNISTKYDTNGNGFGNYIEDTVYCNDRSILSKGGFEPNGGDTTKYLSFASDGRTSSPSVTCPRNIDKFSVSSLIGNGALDYPVGLLSEDEIRLAGGAGSINYTYYLWNGTPGTTNGATSLWSASPYYFLDDNAFIWYERLNGILTGNHVGNTDGVRPVVSLNRDVKFSGGEGSRDNPYIVKAVPELSSH